MFLSLTDSVNAAGKSDRSIASGKALADKLCGRCHATGKNDESRFKTAPPFRTFASKWPLESLEEALAEGITVGHHAMPQFEFQPREITDLLNYIATLSERK